MSGGRTRALFSGSPTIVALRAALYVFEVVAYRVDVTLARRETRGRSR